MNICYSGGAIGADASWGIIAQENNHEVKHYVFNTHRSKEDNLIRLSQDDLNEADPFLIEANKIVNRKYPTKNEYVNNLLRRNYYQIKDTDSVYAISSLDKNSNVDGGTGWAVVMYIQNGSGPIYLYDQNIELWYEYNRLTKSWDEIELPPKPSGKWTGIGTRKLNEFGINAIQDCFDQS